MSDFYGDYTAVTVARCRELLDCDTRTGVLTWKVGRGGGTKAGDQAGTISKQDGYRIVSIDAKNVLASHIVWMFANGAFPDRFMDHKNRIRNDDGLGNLRQATRFENNRNRPINPTSSNPYKGIHFHKRDMRWTAQINVADKDRYLGSSKNPEYAAQIYDEGARQHYGEFACINFPRDIENWL